MNSPTLLIGIGGAGGEILLELSKKISSKQKNNIGFVIMDTDVNSLKKLRDEGYSGEIIATSTNITVGYALSKNTYARDNWFPINSILNRKTLTEGAGQARAISRLAFDSLISSGRIRPLYEIIERLYSTNGESFGQSLRVMVVGSLAGGTGSGILLYLGMHIRDYIKNHYSTDAVIIRGFFLTAEIFKSNLEKQKELVSLMANSYATIKELNAFFMKADNLLPEKKYSTLSFDGLEYETKNIKKYDSLPYDFCFIYDFHSMSGDNLGQKRSYIVHAADCIYALSISPINECSNSMEDNEIISLVNSDGRSRYCGAGESELVFPIDDIIEYLTLKLKNLHLSNQWLKYDMIYLKKKREIKENIEKGMFPIELTRAKSYIDSVNQLAENRDAFSNRIKIENTYLETNNNSVMSMKYNVYLNELKRYVENYIDNELIWKNKKNKLDEKVNSFLNINKKTPKKTCHNIQKKINENMFDISAYLVSSFENDSKEKALNFFIGTTSYLQKNNLNYWIQDNMHPNSVRYFLYSLKEEILKNQIKLNDERDRKLDFLQKYEEKLWIDNRNDTTVNNHKSFIDAYPVIDKKWGFKKYINSEHKSSYKEKIDKFITYVQDFRKSVMFLAFLDECLKQVEILCKHLENFYKNLENSVQKLQYDFEKYENRYSIEPMGRTRYICCDKQCLDYFSKKIDDYSTFYEIPSELSKTIINGIINMNETNDDIQVLNDIYETEIPKFYREYIKDNHSSIANMTILDALELEARIKLDFSTNRKDVEKYVLDIIEKGYRLAEPFISCKHDMKNRTIVACTCNKKLFKDSKIKEFGYIHDKLEKYNKIDDENYIMNNIMFYRAIYGLRADELTKFQPLEKTPTYTEPYGLYYKAYNSIIRDIESGTGKRYYNNKTITPHIHYNWHLITMLPELTKVDQIKIETKICRSLVYGLLIGKIKYYENKDETYSYVYSKEGQIKQLITSSNKKSKSFYELIDALSCDIKLQDEIISEVGDIIKNDVSQYHKLEKSNIYELIKNLKLNKNEIKDIDLSSNISLFTFAILYYITCPNNLYNEEWARYLIDESIYFFDFLIEQLVDISEKAQIIERLFKEQWSIFMKNYNDLKGKYEYLRDNYIEDIKGQIESYFRKTLINKNETEINELIKNVFNI